MRALASSFNMRYKLGRLVLMGPGGYHGRCVLGLVPFPFPYVFTLARVSISLLIRADFACHSCTAYHQRFP